MNAVNLDGIGVAIDNADKRFEDDGPVLIVLTQWSGRQRARLEIADLQRYNDHAAETFRRLAAVGGDLNYGLVELGAVMRALAKEIGKAKYRLRYIRRGIRIARGGR